MVWMKTWKDEPGKSKKRIRFRIGDLVIHRRYDYRGVVVGVDGSCQAEDRWYQNNSTQPDRDQPWYHVLVHEGQHATYVAQENLQSDREWLPVDNPLVKRIFGSFFRGRYHQDYLS